MTIMMRVGIRELRQNPAAAIEAARNGQIVVITDRGTGVAQITPLPGTWRDRMVAAGRLIPRAKSPSELSPPLPADQTEPFSAVLTRMREQER
jgi:prevent-host-death family protein